MSGKIVKKIKEVRDQFKVLYRDTVLSTFDLLPRILINDAMAYLIFDNWSLLEQEKVKKDSSVKYLAVGASDVVATGAYPNGYVQTLRDMFNHTSEDKDIFTFNSSIWGSYARQIEQRLRFNFCRYPNAKFDIASIMVGYNDSLWNIKSKYFERDLRNLIDLTLERTGDVFVLNLKDVSTMKLKGFPYFIEKVISDKPLYKYSLRYQKIMARIEEDYKENPCVHFVNIRENWVDEGQTDLTFDGLHPNISGYNKLAKILFDSVKKNKPSIFN